MGSAPIVVHRLSPSGGRRVTIRDAIVGVAYRDGDVEEFLRVAGLGDTEDLLDDDRWVEWRGDAPHEWGPR
ncbi:hypothetical protein [Streptomyces sp. 769]|uniref:hypothetical protein n=1 Tax=Streptomyces sp. 769 TaxID=1262452 RepID=UPI00057EAAC8|nr:hypothetical protein [Streptomyces sp. 769]